MISKLHKDKNKDKPKQGIGFRLLSSRLTSSVFSLLLFVSVGGLLWFNYFYDEATADNNGEFDVAEGLKGYAGHYLQLEYWERRKDYLQARQYYGSVSNWLDGDAEFRGRAFLGYLSVGDYERASVFFDTLENITADSGAPHYDDAQLRAWLGQNSSFGIRPYADWEKLFHAIKMMRGNKMKEARDYMDKITSDAVIFRYVIPRLAYLTYDNDGDARNSKYVAEITQNVNEDSSLFLSHHARDHDWQKIVDYVNATKQPIHLLDYGTQMFYLHALYQQGQKEKALQVIDRLAPEYHIRRLFYEEIRQAIMNNTLQPLPQDKIYYINQHIVSIVKLLQTRQIVREEGILLARLGLYLNPNDADLFLVITDLLTDLTEEGNDYDAVINLRESLIDAYEDDGFPLWVKFSNQLALALLYSDTEKEEYQRSIDMLHELQQQYPKIYHLYQQEGTVWRVHRKYKKALAAYDKAFEILPFDDYRPLQPSIEMVREIMEQGEKSSFYQQDGVGQWQSFSRLFYLRGITYERLDKIKQSDNDLLFSIAYNPVNASVMNYLGYGWADKDVNIDDAIFLLKRAVVLSPGDGAIIDSLAWAYYKNADYQTATTILENAIQRLPYDIDVNEHLGDAYWQLGLKRQARFQWQRALSLDPEADRLKKIQKKIDKGL